MATPSLRDGIKVLVVDDDFETSLMLCQYLKAEGMRPGYTSNGEEALTWIKNNGNPDVIVLDLDMPIMNGAEFMNAYSGPAAVIVVTGWAKCSLAFKPFTTLTKPQKPCNIVDCIHMAFEASGGPKWTRLLPCKHTCIGIDFEGDKLVLQCLIPGCEKRSLTDTSSLDLETVLELTFAAQQDTKDRLRTERHS